MSDPQPTPRGRVDWIHLLESWPTLTAGIGLVGLLIAFPPFRIVSLNSHKGNQSAAANTATAVFDMAVFSEKFWSEKLLPAATQAPKAGPILSMLKADPTSAARQHGRKVGLGNTAYFFLRATGHVTAIERSRVLVEVEGITVAIRTGPVFGNVLRDASGLLEINQVPGITEFNAVAAELNRFVEQRVQPALKTVALGATLQFSGAAEAPESAPAAGPLLTFIPVQAEILP